MFFTANFYTRILGGIAFAYAARYWGTSYAAQPPTPRQEWAITLLILCGAGLGMLLTHYVTLYPFRKVVRAMQAMTLPELVAKTLGVVSGLFIGALLAVPLSRLPSLLGALLPVAVALAAAYAGVLVASARRSDWEHWFDGQQGAAVPVVKEQALVDTSVIIDGRIGEVVRTGFLPRHLVVPRFVLNELQQLADAGDPLVRTKGKRGLDVLRALQANTNLTVEVSELDVPAIEQVDHKLVAVASSEGMPLLTNDGNLQQVAALQGVRVLNLHALQEALRTQWVVGDHLRLTIRGEGREREQGVGYLSDGTMVIVEDARSLVGHERTVAITRVYTTATGRMLFAQLIEEEAHPLAAEKATQGERPAPGSRPAVRPGGWTSSSGSRSPAGQR